MDAKTLADYLQDKLPLTLRDGVVLMTVNQISQRGEHFMVVAASATYNDTPVRLNLPWATSTLSVPQAEVFTVTSEEKLLYSFKKIFANYVRHCHA